MPLFEPLTLRQLARMYHGSQQGYIAPGSSTTLMTGTGSLAGSTLSTDASSLNEINSAGARFFRQTGGATTGTNNGSFADSASCEMANPLHASFVLGISNVTSVRFFVGLVNTLTLGDICDADTLGAAGFGFQFSTDRSDTVFQAVSYNGSSQTTTPTTLAPVANTIYRFTFDIISSSEVIASIYNTSGVLLTSSRITATLPTSTTELRMGVGLEPRSNVAINIDHHSWGMMNLSYGAATL